jgi:hypothetical protein
MRRNVLVRLLCVLFSIAAIVAMGLVGAACGDENPGVGGTDTPDAQFDAPRVDAGGEPDSSSAADAAAATFNVVAAASTGHTSMTVTFDAPPDPALAVDLAHYAVDGLTLSGTPTLSGSVVTIESSAQLVEAYTVTVSGVTRASDGQVLTAATATFQGSPPFDVKSAEAKSAKTVAVTFDAPPNPVQAVDVANYSVPGLTLSAPALSGSTVTLTTTAQAAQTYTVTVSNVTRATDGDPLVGATADFTGRTPFSVASAQATNAATITVTFDAAPTDAEATKLANYAVAVAGAGGAPLALSGTPVLSGNTVTLTTAPQAAVTYTVTVSNVTRASDSEPLDVKTADFAGIAPAAPTVTNVVVASTNPNNGTTPYNTGTTTVTITGTDFITVACPDGVKLDDLDGAPVPALVGTKATACTVDSDTQITATFPAGIRTNGATGWNVIVTNAVGSNAASYVKIVPVAGLLVSEIYTGTVGDTDHEFVEIYNPTANAIDTTGAGIGLRLHVRNGTGSSDTNKTLTLVTTGIIPSHGFLLFVSSASAAPDAWYDHRDYTFSAALVANGGVYISLSDDKDAKVIDKAGWGTQPAGGYEGTALANVASGFSAERKPAGGGGHATDTDSNVDDFNLPVPAILATPRGTVDTPQP